MAYISDILISGFNAIFVDADITFIRKWKLNYVWEFVFF